MLFNTRVFHVNNFAAVNSFPSTRSNMKVSIFDQLLAAVAVVVALTVVQSSCRSWRPQIPKTEMSNQLNH